MTPTDNKSSSQAIYYKKSIQMYKKQRCNERLNGLSPYIALIGLALGVSALAIIFHANPQDPNMMNDLTIQGIVGGGLFGVGVTAYIVTHLRQYSLMKERAALERTQPGMEEDIAPVTTVAAPPRLSEQQQAEEKNWKKRMCNYRLYALSRYIMFMGLVAGIAALVYIFQAKPVESGVMKDLVIQGIGSGGLLVLGIVTLLSARARMKALREERYKGTLAAVAVSTAASSSTAAPTDTQPPEE